MLWGLPIPPRLRRLDAPVVVAAATAHSVPRAAGFTGVRVREARFGVAEFDGIRVTDPLTTWCLLARELDRRDLIAAGDILVTDSCRTDRRCPALPLQALVDGVTAWGTASGALVLRDAVSRLRVGVDSPMESILRTIIVDGGFPEPTVHPTVVLADGRERHPDLGYEDLQLAIEYEGAGHADPDRMRQDITRVEDFADAGWLTVRTTNADLFPTPTLFLRRLDRARTQAAAHQNH